MANLPVYTTNPIVLAYADLRRSVGFWVSHRTEGWGSYTGWRRKLWEFGIDTEGDYNCLIEPLLGKTIKWEKKQHKAMYAGANAQRAGLHGEATRYFDQSREYQDRKDYYIKLRYPDYTTRRELLDEQLARIEERMSESN